MWISISSEVYVDPFINNIRIKNHSKYFLFYWGTGVGEWVGKDHLF